MQANRLGLALQRHALRRRFLSACKVLGLARLRTLTIHQGRHTYISHALVLQFYVHLLHWPGRPSAAELAAWVASKLDTLSIEVLISGSQEFFGNG